VPRLILFGAIVLVLGAAALYAQADVATEVTREYPYERAILSHPGLTTEQYNRAVQEVVKERIARNRQARERTLREDFPFDQAQAAFPELTIEQYERSVDAAAREPIQHFDLTSTPADNTTTTPRGPSPWLYVLIGASLVFSAYFSQ